MLQRCTKIQLLRVAFHLRWYWEQSWFHQGPVGESLTNLITWGALWTHYVSRETALAERSSRNSSEIYRTPSHERFLSFDTLTTVCEHPVTPQVSKWSFNIIGKLFAKSHTRTRKSNPVGIQFNTRRPEKVNVRFRAAPVKPQNKAALPYLSMDTLLSQTQPHRQNPAEWERGPRKSSAN